MGQRFIELRGTFCRCSASLADFTHLPLKHWLKTVLVDEFDISLSDVLLDDFLGLRVAHGALQVVWGHSVIDVVAFCDQSCELSLDSA